MLVPLPHRLSCIALCCLQTVTAGTLFALNISTPEIGSDGRGYPVSLGIEVAANLDRIAGLPLVVVLVHRRLQQECVLPFGRSNFLHTLLSTFHEHARFEVAHKPPHPLVNRNFRSLESKHKVRYSKQ